MPAPFFSTSIMQSSRAAAVARCLRQRQDTDFTVYRHQIRSYLTWSPTEDARFSAAGEKVTIVRCFRSERTGRPDHRRGPGHRARDRAAVRRARREEASSSTISTRIAPRPSRPQLRERRRRGAAGAVRCHRLCVGCRHGEVERRDASARIDILVNNAGNAGTSPIEKQPAEFLGGRPGRLEPLARS